jgi:sugar lactone lactonase YvrE
MLSNGLTWSADLKTFYYIDTGELRIDAFDYDDASGDISKKLCIHAALFRTCDWYV